MSKRIAGLILFLSGAAFAEAPIVPGNISFSTSRVLYISVKNTSLRQTALVSTNSSLLSITINSKTAADCVTLSVNARDQHRGLSISGVGYQQGGVYTFNSVMACELQ